MAYKMASIVLNLLFSWYLTFSPALQSEVFICKGPMSKVYHKSSRCKGLSSCSTEVYGIRVDEAKKLGRRACRIEFK
jgi:hypothetical protein